MYGDGRVFGKRKSTVLSISNINNIQYLKGKGFHSSKDQWPVAIFYFGDDRTNLEINLEKLDINAWINDMESESHQIFLSADTLFQKEIAGGTECTDRFQFDVFTKTSRNEFANYCEITGRRSSLAKDKSLFTSVYTDKLLNIPIHNWGICVDHGITRICEHLLMLIVEEIHQ